MLSPALAADLITGIHLIIVLFMIGGLLVIPLGGLLRWEWVRSPWFRIPHLGIMIYIMQNAIRGRLCFLTHWEMNLRHAAGQADRSDMSFIGRLLHDFLFVDNVSMAFLNAIYLVFGTLVIVGLVFVPPRFRATDSRPRS